MGDRKRNCSGPWANVKLLSLYGIKYYVRYILSFWSHPSANDFMHSHCLEIAFTSANFEAPPCRLARNIWTIPAFHMTYGYKGTITCRRWGDGRVVNLSRHLLHNPSTSVHLSVRHSGSYTFHAENILNLQHVCHVVMCVQCCGCRVTPLCIITRQAETESGALHIKEFTLRHILSTLFVLAQRCTGRNIISQRVRTWCRTLMVLYQEGFNQSTLKSGAFTMC